MDPDAWISEEPRRRRPPSVPRLVAAVLVGCGFALAVALAAALPAVAAAALVAGVAVRDVVAVLVLWAASATVAVAGYVVITRTGVGAALQRLW